MTARRKVVCLCTGLTLALFMAKGFTASAQGNEPLQRPAANKEEVPDSHRPIRVFPASDFTKTFAAPKIPNVILYDQTDNPNTNAFNSQNFEAAYDEYDNQGADDFVVSGAGWVVNTVVTPGVYFNGPGPAVSLHVTFYDNAGTVPGAVVAGCDYPAVTSFSGGATGAFTTTLSPPCTLTPGPKWVSVQVNMNFGTGGQWGWTMRNVQSNNPAAWRNPGGGFPGGCTAYTSRIVCDSTTSTSPDNTFRLEGTFASCTVDGDCQDGDQCNGAEVCTGGICGPGTPVNCDDGLFCTNDSCAPATGACSHAPNLCSDGDSCSLDFCNEGTDSCTHVTPPVIHRCNTGAISIPDSGTATPYPSTISVAGLSPSGGLCSVELLGISHTFPNDIDMLVVGPGTPQNAIVMSDVGGTTGATGVNLTLKDSAAAGIPSPLVSGTFKPTNVGAGDTFTGAPAPTGGSALSVFDGTNPNGDWKLYIVDDVGGDSGTVATGWCVNIVVGACATDGECNDGNLCNGTETCVAGTCTPGTAVNCDDGLFCTIDSCTPATGACGHAPNTCADGNPCTSDACDEAGDTCLHNNASRHFCNTGSISIPSSGAGSPYPSPIVISGQPTAGSVCSVELLGITHTFPDDIDILLARTSGPNALILSDIGGGTDVTGVNLVLSDGAATSLPDGSPLVSGTFKPTNSNTGGTDSAFPAPAPAISGPSALSTFDGADPNGVWNLWVRDEFTPDTGTITGGWCLNLVVNSCTSDGECSDGNLCNGIETCVSGSCTPGTPVDCSDGLFCTVDACTPASGACTHAPNPCGDGDGCTADSCDESADTCIHSNACTQVCNTGPIAINDSTTPPTIASPYPSAINIAAPHGTFSVVSVQLLGISHTFPDDIDILLSAPHTASTATLMSDVGGSVAASGVNLTLTDGAPVIPDTGPLVSGTFSPTNVNPGTGTEAWPAPAPLPGGGTALSQFDGTDPDGDWNLWVVDDQGIDSGSIAGGWCLNYRVTCSTADDCNDNDACTTDVCDPVQGCLHTSISCDDGNACTTDTCDSVSGCGHTNNTDACDDGNACTSGDTCGGGTCNGGTPVVCDDGNVCNGVETCSPSTGCAPGTPIQCDDGNVCNGAESCNPTTGCVAGTPLVCNDGNACNGVETCNPASGCAPGTPPVCDDGNACNGVETCTPASGCAPGTPLVCNDGNACNGVETCSPATGCVGGTPPTCNDGNVCNGVETCNPSSGCVGGTPLVCNDGNACTTDTCSPASGCVYSNNTNACDDGNACTTVDACSGGSCVGSVPVVCSAADQCHVAGTCSPSSGLCSNPAKPDGTTCDDGNAGTSPDACQAGVCVGGTVCTSSNDPKTWGWWHSQCTSGGHSGDSIDNADAACVAATSAAFSGITTAAQVCEILSPSHGNNSTASKAEKQQMTLALNICSHRICPSQGLDATCSSAATVGQAFSSGDAILVNPGHTNAQLAVVECQATEINNGHALEFDTLELKREGGNVRLNWMAPTLDDGTGTPSRYKLWRRPMGSMAPFVQIGTTTGLTFLDTTAGTVAWQYDLTPVY